MSAIYMIDGKWHELCKCDGMSSVCPKGATRAMQTAGYQQCFVPCEGIVIPLESPASPHEQGQTPEVDGLEFYAQWGSSGDGGNVIHADDARSLERRLRSAVADERGRCAGTEDHSFSVQEKDRKLLCAFTPTSYSYGYPWYFNLTMLRQCGDVVLTVRKSPDNWDVGEGKTSCVRFTREMWREFVRHIEEANKVHEACEFLDSQL